MKTVIRDDEIDYPILFYVSRNKYSSDPLAHLLSLLIVQITEKSHKSDGILDHGNHSLQIFEINHYNYHTLKKMKILWVLGVILLISILQLEARRITNKKKILPTENIEDVKSEVSEKNEVSQDKKVDTDSKDLTSITVSDVLSSSKNSTKEKLNEKDSKKNSVAKPKAGLKLFELFYNVVDQILSFIGVTGPRPTPAGARRQKDVDISEDNFVNSQSITRYREEIQTTVGAALGKGQCLQKAACRAGKYLKEIRGKEIILVVLEKFSPEKWIDTVELVKDSAIHNEECDYKCFEK